MLIDILNSISSVRGKLNLSDTTIKSTWVSRVNEAARGLYERIELLDATRVATFLTADLVTDIIALPWYVMKPIVLRNLETLETFQFTQQAARFQDVPRDWNQFTMVRRSPMNREILNAGPLTFTLKAAESATFRISGKTNLSSNHIETLTITNGLSATTTSFWETVESITQDAHSYDTTVTDIDDNVVSYLPNSLTEVFYTHYRYRDNFSRYFSKEGYLELLYKPHYEPMLDDRSNFQCGSRYDDAIKYMVLSRDALESIKDPGLAQNYDAKAMAIVLGLHKNAQSGLQEVVLKPSNMLNVAQQTCHGSFPKRLYRGY